MSGKKQVRAGDRPTRDRDATRQRLIDAVGELLAQKGFTGLGVNALARQAGVDKVLIYRYFGGLPELIRAFGRESDFWPGIEELAGGDIQRFKRLSTSRQLIAMGHNFLTGIRRRPLTQEIMAWEMIQRNELTETLADIRETRMLRFAQMFLQKKADGIDLMAIIAIIGSGISYLVCRARRVNVYNGVDLNDETGWQRIEGAVEQIVRGVMKLTDNDLVIE